MEPDRLQAISERDQLWASLRGLHAEIERLAAGEFDGSERHRQLVSLLARIVVAEMDYRRRDAAS